MTRTRAGAIALRVVAAIATAACSPPADQVPADQVTDAKAAIPTADAGTCTLQRAPDGGVAVLRGPCPRTAASVSAALAKAGALTGVTEVALGQVPFVAGGVFDRCDLWGRLARDPRWTTTIDSAAAQPVLAATLSAMRPVDQVGQALNRPVARVSAEMVILEPAGTGCPAAPAKVPFEAQLWMVLGR